MDLLDLAATEPAKEIHGVNAIRRKRIDGAIVKSRWFGQVGGALEKFDFGKVNRTARLDLLADRRHRRAVATLEPDHREATVLASDVAQHARLPDREPERLFNKDVTSLPVSYTHLTLPTIYSV